MGQRVRSLLLPSMFAGALLLASFPCRGGTLFDFDAGDDATKSAVQALLAADTGSPPTSLRSEVRSFYEIRNFEPAWTGSEDARERAVVARSVLKDAPLEGLKSRDYLSVLSEWDAKSPVAGRDAANYDILLTAALLRYSTDVRDGRVKPADVYRDVSLPPHIFHAAAELAKAIRRDELEDYLSHLRPLHPGYSYLRSALAHYRAVADAGGWPRIPAGKPFAIDGKDPRQKILTKRLAFEDAELAAISDPTNDDIRDAVLRYQTRNGLKPDGSVGTEMLKFLNVSADYRAAQIAANMERWRWMPRLLEPRYIEVDVPDESLKYVSDGQVLLHSIVVIGMKRTPTPILRTVVQDVVANPPWDIPDDIAARKYLSRLRRNPHYLAEHKLRLAGAPAGVTVDWRHVKGSKLPYQIQQDPGPENVLGDLMLDMPNPFNVYLHDTSNKKLFTLDDREKSNGCVRVKEISKLATLALTGSTDEDSDLSDAIASAQTTRLSLADPLAVYMVYWTAIAFPDGTVGFRPDLYDRDPPLIRALGAAPASRRPHAEASAKHRPKARIARAMPSD